MSADRGIWYNTPCAPGSRCSSCLEYATRRMGDDTRSVYCDPCFEAWDAYIKDPDNAPRPHLRERAFSEKALELLKAEGKK